MANGYHLSPLPPDRTLGWRHGQPRPTLARDRQQLTKYQQQIRKLRAKVQSQETQLEGKQGRKRLELETSIHYDEQLIQKLETDSLPYQIRLKEQHIQYQEERIQTQEATVDKLMRGKPAQG